MEDSAINRLFANPDLMKKGFKQAVPPSVKALGLVSNILTVIALGAFFTNPTPNGLVNAAWFYIIGKILSFIVEAASGWKNGFRQTKFFSSLSESQQRQLTKIFLTNHAVRGFCGIHTPVLFLDWHEEIIRDLLEKNAEYLAGA